MSEHPHGHSCEHGHPCVVNCSDSHPHFCGDCFREAMEENRAITSDRSVPEDDPQYQHEPTLTMASSVEHNAFVIYTQDGRLIEWMA